MKKRKIVSALLAMLLTFSAVSCSTTDEPSSDSSLDSTLSMEGSESSEDTPFTMPKYIPTWTSVNQHNTGGTAPEWFMDAKFGIYFHWGPYCVPAFGSEWYPKLMYDVETGNYANHVKKYGDPFTEWPYHYFITGAEDKQGNWVEFAPKLKSEGGEFDPEEWAQLFLDAGAKFAGPVAEHSDGWSNWDSEVNEWNAVDMGPHLDLVGLLTDAIREKGLKTLVTLHHAYGINGDYFTNAPLQEDPSLQKLYCQLPWDQESELWLEKCKEVIDQYQPDLIWHDSGIWKVDEATRLEFLAYYYNKEEEWGKEVVVTSKGGFSEDSNVQDYERGGPADITENYWLTDDSLSPWTWCYTEGTRYYTPQHIIHTLADRISKNGNLLLNILPKADGSIPQNQKDILLAVGDWLKKNGEGVYATRAWEVFGEGPTQLGGGDFQEMKTGTAQDICFTRTKDNTTLYAIVLGWPGDGAVLNIQTLAEGRIDLSSLTSVQLIGAAAGEYIDLSYTQTAEGLAVTMPDTMPCEEDAYMLKLSFSGEIPPLTPVSTPAE